MTLEHLGIAVADADAAVALFERLLGAAPYKTETVEREGVRTIFFGDGGRVGTPPKLELLDALSPESPVATYLDRRGPGLHHVAFEVEDIEAEMRRLSDLGFQLLAEAPKPGADGKRIVFLHPRSTGGVLVELCASVPVEPERLAVPYDGGHLAAWVSGPAGAPPLVVLHGAFDSARGETAGLAARLARRFRVHALDFMAHGASDPYPGRAFSLRDFSDNALALLDATGLDRAPFFGYSMGGAVALLVALRWPERVTRLVTYGTRPQWTEAQVEELLYVPGPDRLRGVSPDWAAHLAEQHGAERWPDLVKRSIAFSHALPAQPLIDEDLAVIPHPTLVACGDRDPVLGSSVGLHRALPKASLAVLPVSGHAITDHVTAHLAPLVADHVAAAA